MLRCSACQSRIRSFKVLFEMNQSQPLWTGVCFMSILCKWSTSSKGHARLAPCLSLLLLVISILFFSQNTQQPLQSCVVIHLNWVLGRKKTDPKCGGFDQNFRPNGVEFEKKKEISTKIFCPTSLQPSNAVYSVWLPTKLITSNSKTFSRSQKIQLLSERET